MQIAVNKNLGRIYPHEVVECKSRSFESSQFAGALIFYTNNFNHSYSLEEFTIHDSGKTQVPPGVGPTCETVKLLFIDEWWVWSPHGSLSCHYMSLLAMTELIF